MRVTTEARSLKRLILARLRKQILQAFDGCRGDSALLRRTKDGIEGHENTIRDQGIPTSGAQLRTAITRQTRTIRPLWHDFILA